MKLLKASLDLVSISNRLFIRYEPYFFSLADASK
jgi:hypothetical protein